MAKIEKVEVNRLSDNFVLTVNVRITRRFKHRMWLALTLIRLAARIYPGKMLIEEEVG